jgi:CheY-like chemotaxis protein
VLLFDLGLPDESGLDVLREIRGSEGATGADNPGLPVIVVSAFQRHIRAPQRKNVRFDEKRYRASRPQRSSKTNARFAWKAALLGERQLDLSGFAGRAS